MSDFLFETLLWTGALLALVLLLRRPVAQLFGARAAYALWALPMARLLLPPLVLPGWMAPTTTAAMQETALVEMAAEAPLAGTVSMSDAPSLAVAGPMFDWAGLMLGLWLAGAAIFLVRRYALYFRMRRELLAGARPMGEAGRVRLVETPGADGPVAFGVIDKVVALPIGFMAGQDRAARDLALAHELAHHRGHDLVCNMLVQPLFALHWFHPLGLLGWRALRRDQEAACDARVMARESRERRAAYAAVIARFAIQPRHAAKLMLAAPMACPVLGDRSIVQRLKSLSMNDFSARRRWSGRLMIAAAALALPLTGSISYARSEPLPTPPHPPAPPAPPAPAMSPVAVTAPVAPEPPRTPEVPPVILSRGGTVHGVGVGGGMAQSGDSGDPRIARHVILRPGSRMTAADQADFQREMAEHAREMAAHGRKLATLGYSRVEQRRDAEEFRRDMAGFQREMARERISIDRDLREAAAEAHAHASVAARAVAHAPRVVVGCRQGQKEVAETIVTQDGRQQILVCKSIATAEARRALAMARVEIHQARDVAAEQNNIALRSIDLAERDQKAN